LPKLRLVITHLRPSLRWIARYLPIALFACSIIAWIWSVRGGGTIALTTPFVHPFGIHHREFEIRVYKGAMAVSTTGWFETEPGNLSTILRVRGYWPQIHLTRYGHDRQHFLSFVFNIQPGETALSAGIGVGKRRALVFPLWTSTIVFGLLAWGSVRRTRKPAQVGFCPTCDYDLRGNVDPARCPECGNNVPASSARNM
jgi:hypothetical protein